MSKKVLSFLPLLAVMCLILYFSSRTGIESKAQSGYFVEFLNPFLNYSVHVLTLIVRKSGHIFEYCLLTFTAFYFFKVGLNLKKSFFITLIFCYLYSCFDEIFQSYIPLRAGRFSDTLIDLIGILFALLLIFLIKKPRVKRGKS